MLRDERLYPITVAQILVLPDPAHGRRLPARSGARRRRRITAHPTLHRIFTLGIG